MLPQTPLVTAPENTKIGLTAMTLKYKSTLKATTSPIRSADISDCACGQWSKTHSDKTAHLTTAKM